MAKPRLAKRHLAKSYFAKPRNRAFLQCSKLAGPVIFVGFSLFLMQWYWYPVALISLTILVFYFAGLSDRAKQQESKRRLSARTKHIDRMSGAEFENHLAEYFAACGYRIETTPTTGDFGADLVLRSRTECIVVQAKRWNSRIGISAVQEISTARHFYGADSALLITNSSLTRSAKELARRANVTVWERNTLFEKLM